MARAIDASHFGEIMEQWKKDCLESDDQHGADVIADVILQLDDMPTLTQPNEPLTLEQLRQMDGEPVWFDTIKRWGIVKVNREGVFVITKSGEYEFGRCKVYRRPPEGDEKT